MNAKDSKFGASRTYATISTSGLLKGIDSKFVWLQALATIQICL